MPMATIATSSAESEILPNLHLLPSPARGTRPLLSNLSVYFLWRMTDADHLLPRRLTLRVRPSVPLSAAGNLHHKNNGKRRRRAEWWRAGREKIADQCTEWCHFLLLPGAKKRKGERYSPPLSSSCCVRETSSQSSLHFYLPSPTVYLVSTCDPYRWRPSCDDRTPYRNGPVRTGGLGM